MPHGSIYGGHSRLVELAQIYIVKKTLFVQTWFDSDWWKHMSPWLYISPLQQLAPHADSSSLDPAG